MKKILFVRSIVDMWVCGCVGYGLWVWQYPYRKVWLHAVAKSFRTHKIMALKLSVRSL